MVEKGENGGYWNFLSKCIQTVILLSKPLAAFTLFHCENND